MAKEYDVKKLQELIKERDVVKIKEFMKENELIIIGNTITSKYHEEFDRERERYDLFQYVKKICLNSEYGNSLQTSSTFFDFRLGSSTTMSGRQVVKHLTSKANEILCNHYADKGYCATYNDTDSVYCYINNEHFKKCHPNFEFTKENIIKFSDRVADEINDSFPSHMIKMFHCTKEGSELQKAAKEVVASKGLFVSKKRYALLVYEHDGFRQDNNGSIGEMKIMGLQVKRSDCPLLVRQLLKDMLTSALVDGTKDRLIHILKDFGTNNWKLLNPWEKGCPKAVNKLTQYYEQYKQTHKCSVGQVMASINWNILVDAFKDVKSPKILDGNKVIVCKLKKNNPYGMNSIAYPLEITKLPEWFKTLPFDEQSMKDSIVDKTIETIFGVLDWKLTLDNAMSDNDDMNDILTFMD